MNEERLELVAPPVAQQTAPILALPNELLIAIFESGNNLSFGAGEREFRLQVAQVTRRWRNVVINMSQLWTKIDITSITPLDLLADYLKRSGCFPLHLTIDFSREIKSSVAMIILHTIIPHIHRWRRLSIKSSSLKTTFELISLFSPLSALCLEDLHVSWTGDNADCDPTVVSKTFNGGTPMLRYLRLDVIGLHFCTPHLATVTRLYLHTPDRSMDMSHTLFLRFLRELPSLMQLAIYGTVVCHWPDTASSSMTVEMPSLDSLEISDRFVEMRCYLTAISAPALRSLVLSYIVDGEFEVPPDQIRLKYPAIQSLTFIDATIRRQTFASLNQMFPNITHLAWLNSSSESILEALGNGSGAITGPLWLNLQSVTFSEANMISIRSAVDSRISFGYPIVKLYLATNISEGETHEVATCLREKVEVEEFPVDAVPEYAIRNPQPSSPLMIPLTTWGL